MLLFTNTRIIIAEDEEMFRTILTRYCQIWGFSVVAACDNGRDAILEAARLKPDMMLLDLDMPNYSGLEVAAALRKKFPKIRLVVISGVLQPKCIKQALKLGVDGILDKRRDTFDKIGDVLPKILDGEHYYSPTVVEVIVAENEKKMVSEGSL